MRKARFVFVSTAVLLAAAPAFAAGLSVPMDEVRVVAFGAPVSTVYMGNPSIADVTMIDPRHAFVLGKTFGETNLIALGANGRTVANEHIIVDGKRLGAVTLNRGAQTFNYSCTAMHCETQPVPGDPKEYFDNTHQATTEHEGLGEKSAAGSSTGGGAQ